MATHSNFGELLGIAPATEFDLTLLVEGGLPTEKLAVLREKGLTSSEVSEIVIAPRTLKHRKARGEALSHEESDRLVRVARVVALAEEIFGDREKALLWLRTPDDRIGDRSPMSLLQTESGGRLVEGMLWQIDENVYA